MTGEDLGVGLGDGFGVGFGDGFGVTLGLADGLAVGLGDGSGLGSGETKTTRTPSSFSANGEISCGFLNITMTATTAPTVRINIKMTLRIFLLLFFRPVATVDSSMSPIIIHHTS